MCRECNRDGGERGRATNNVRGLHVARGREGIARRARAGGTEREKDGGEGGRGTLCNLLSQQRKGERR